MDNLRALYKTRYESYLGPLASRLQKSLEDYLGGQPRVDRIVARAKAVESFVRKARKLENAKLKYNDPMSQIQDLVGCRIVTYYLPDVSEVEALVLKYFRPIENRAVLPDSESEFGYFGKHMILFVPKDLLDTKPSKDTYPCFFELQIKTLFQHAWAQANHDLGYKSAWTWGEPNDAREIAFASAQAWGADRIFAGLYRRSLAMKPSHGGPDGATIEQSPETDETGG